LKGADCPELLSPDWSPWHMPPLASSTNSLLLSVRVWPFLGTWACLFRMITPWPGQLRARWICCCSRLPSPGGAAIALGLAPVPDCLEPSAWAYTRRQRRLAACRPIPLVLVVHGRQWWADPCLASWISSLMNCYDACAELQKLPSFRFGFPDLEEERVSVQWAFASGDWLARLWTCIGLCRLPELASARRLFPLRAAP